MQLSIMTPISLSWDRMMHICFRPFDFNKWLSLGFCAWLAGLGSSGGFNVPGVGDDLFKDLPDTSDLGALWSEVGVYVGAGAVVLLVLFVVLSWLACRGEFMLIDGIAHNRGLVSQPWTELGPQANSIFVTRLVLHLVSLAILAGIGVASYFQFAPFFSDFSFDDPSPALIHKLSTVGVGLGAGLFVLLFVWSLLASVLTTFVVPIMYARRCQTLEAWNIMTEELVRNGLGVMIGFLIVYFFVGLGAGLVAALAVMCTCCLAALPYVGAVALLPISVFLRACALYFVEQFGPTLVIFAPAAAPAPAEPVQS
jgi:hypothetical protein